MFVFRVETQCFVPSHQLAGGREDNADAKVFGVALDFNAEEVWNGRNFSTQRKYTNEPLNSDSILGNYLREAVFLALSKPTKGINDALRCVYRTSKNG